MPNNLLLDIGVIIILATLLAYAARLLRQPLLIAYVLTGIVLGQLTGAAAGIEDVKMLADFGIAFLLFTIGLEIDVQKLRSVGKASLVGGFTQVGITFATGYIVSGFLGFDSVTGIYIGALVAFSSTMIVAKLLVDRNEINTLHGRIMIGVLLLQDIIVIMLVTMIRSIGGEFSFDLFINSLINGFGLFAIAVVLNRFVFKSVLEKVSRSGELLFLTTVSVAFAFISVSSVLDFPIAIGAFFGGLALAQTPYNFEIYHKMRSLRDFFLVIFFSTLGIQLNLASLGSMIWEFVALLAIIVVMKPVILSLIYLLMGYGGRTSSSIGLGMGQASEFSFILASMGLALGHISGSVFSLIISVMIVSVIVTPYLMRSRNAVYKAFRQLDIPGARMLSRPRHLESIQRKPESVPENHIVVFGCHLMGRRIVDYLKSMGVRFIVVEHNPEVIKELASEGVYAIYGDAENDEIFKAVGLYKARVAVVTIPDVEVSCYITSKAKRYNPGIKIYARAHSEADAQTLYSNGADFVVVPDFVSGGTIIRKLELVLHGKRNGRHFRHLDVRKRNH